MIEPSDEQKIDNSLERIYALMASGNLKIALERANEAYSLNYEKPELRELLCLLKYWDERWERLSNFSSDYEKGKFLLGEWKLFLQWYKNRKKIPLKKGLLSLKKMVYSASLNHFESLLDLSTPPDQELLLRIGVCYKVLGYYEKAIGILEKAIKLNRENAVVLAELADTYALVDEIQGAKILFREAFFISPDKIDIFQLESALVGRLVEKMRQAGIEENLLSEWLPVYGVIYGVLNVKRELRSLESGKLKQSIFSLQGDIKKDVENKALVPRLINKYFWLIDHYVSTKEDRQTIDEVLKNIRFLDSSIYQQYIN